MTIRRMRNNVKLTDVIQNVKDGSFYGFGIVLDGEASPNFVFFPPKVIGQYEILSEDIGNVFDCIFRDDPRAKKDGGKCDPVVMAIYEEGDPVGQTVVIDEKEEFACDGEPDEGDVLPEFITRG